MKRLSVNGTRLFRGLVLVALQAGFGVALGLGEELLRLVCGSGLLEGVVTDLAQEEIVELAVIRFLAVQLEGVQAF